MFLRDCQKMMHSLYIEGEANKTTLKNFQSESSTRIHQRTFFECLARILKSSILVELCYLSLVFKSELLNVRARLVRIIVAPVSDNFLLVLGREPIWLAINIVHFLSFHRRFHVSFDAKIVINLLGILPGGCVRFWRNVNIF